MKLRDWRKAEKLTQTQVADRLTELAGVTVTHDQVSRIENGQIPSRELGAALIRLTDNKVGPADFYEAA